MSKNGSVCRLYYSYSKQGVNAEHETVRNGVCVFDVSHMGEIMLKGENALDLNYATIEEFSNQINYKNVA